MSLMFQRPNTFGEAAFYPYKINQSCRFNDDDSAYLVWTPSGTVSDRSKFTLSIWFKRCNLGLADIRLFNAYDNVNNRNGITFNSSNQLSINNIVGGSITTLKTTTRVFRDIGSWYHLCVIWDTADATAEDRCKIYINGVRETSFSTNNNPSLNEITIIGSANPHVIGEYAGSGSYYYDGYIAEIILTNNVAEYTDFGKFKNGIWIPKEYTSSYGTNGFYLDFADSADLGNDVSGNNNDFTSSGLTSDDKVLDSPTNNYCTLNTLDFSIANSFRNGNLTVQGASSAAGRGRATIIVNSSIKTYFEVTLTRAPNLPAALGFRNANEAIATTWLQSFDRLFYIRPGHGDNGDVWDGSSWSASYGTPAQGDVIGFAVYDNKLWISINNSWVNSGDPAAGTGYVLSNLADDIMPFWCDESSSNYVIFDFNFGQLGFTYTPPTGYKALCSNNLPTPSIKDSSTGFDVVLWTGNDTERVITTNFQPDLVWAKNRDAVTHHVLQDSIRGFTTDKKICSNESYAENAAGVDDQYGYISAVDGSGFTISKDGTGANDWVQLNKNTQKYIAWYFRMGVKYGFDIISDVGTGAAHAISHNLSGEPELIIRKNRDTLANPSVYHHYAGNKTDPETDLGWLNFHSAWSDDIAYWNDTAPTSIQFTVGTAVQVNENTKNFITYLWRSIEGFSKVFSYTGNGNVDGPFVYCGFRPRYILYKNAHAAYDWGIFDTERSTYNVVNKRLIPNTYGVEDTIAGIEMDILSNGFKIRGTHANINGSGNVLVGIAISEQSSKWSNSR